MWLNYYTDFLLNLILNKYFQDSRCILFFTENLNYIGELPNVKLKIINGSCDLSIIFKNFGCQGVVIQSENPISIFKNFEKEIRLNLERFNQRRYLIFSSDDVTLEEETSYFEQKELNYVADLLLINRRILKNEINSFSNNNDLLLTNQMKDVEFVFKTHKFTGFNDSNTIVILDKWFSRNESFLLKNNLFPDKLSDQQGRPLLMATFNYEPYSIVEQENNDYFGSELTSMVQYSLKHNMTPIPIINENDYWGELFANWTGIGLLGNLVEDKADIGFSALYTWENCYHFLDLSKPLVRTGITCLVPAPKLSSGWLTPLYSYSLTLWFYVILVFLCLVAAFAFVLLFYNKVPRLRILYGKKHHLHIWNFIGFAIFIVSKPMLYQPLTTKEMPRELSSKFIFFWIFLFGLLLTSTYSSGLSTVMTIPRYNDAIDTVEQFADSELNWGATQDAWITSIQKANESAYVKIVSKFQALSEQSLEELSNSEDWAFSIERLPFENYAIGSYIKQNVVTKYHLMQQDFYWEQCVIMLRKNSILLPSLDSFILKIFEAGLISKWQNEAVNLFMDPKVQRLVKYYKYHMRERGVVTKLRWTNVEGAFAVLALGFCIGFVVLLIEIIVEKNRRRNFIKFFRN